MCTGNFSLRHFCRSTERGLVTTKARPLDSICTVQLVNAMASDAGRGRHIGLRQRELRMLARQVTFQFGLVATAA